MTSPSTIASRGPSPACNSSSTSGNWALTRSCRRVNSSISPSAVRCACTRMPSYLYSAAHRPPSLARISSASDSRCASMTRTGLPARTLQLLDGLQPFERLRVRNEGRGDETEVAADVVRALEHRPLLPPAGVHLGQRVEDRRRPDPEPEIARHQPEQVAGLQRCRPPDQAGEQFELPTLRANPRGGGDLQQSVDDLGDPQTGRPVPRRLRDQQFGTLTKIAGLADGRDDLLGRAADRGADRTHGQLLGHPQVDAGELRRDHPLAEVADRRQLRVGSVGDQRGQPGDQCQPTGGLLEVLIGQCDSLVLHDDILAETPAVSAAACRG